MWVAMKSVSKLYLHIGTQIAETRQRTWMSQECLARAVGVSRSTISTIEKGAQQVYVHTLVKIAAVLKINLENLLPDNE
jgi:DNA-binding XRE family transcriptional regulator